MQIFTVKLLANSLVAIDYYIALTMFEQVFTFHIAHTTWDIIF